MPEKKHLALMTKTEIEQEYGLLFPCRTCGARPPSPCHKRGQPAAGTYIHQARLEVLQRMHSLGWQTRGKWERQSKKALVKAKAG